MSTVIKIQNTDRSSEIDYKTFNLQRAITNQTDTLQFTIKRSSSGDYKPSLLDDVQVIEDGVTLFGGNIITIDEQVDGLVEYVKITCKDYSFDLDRLLVVDVFENMTVYNIIKSIIGVGNALDFDGTNDYVESGSNVAMNGVTFSLSGWWKRDVSGALHYILSQGAATNNNGLQVGLKADDTFTVSFFNNDLTSVTTYTDTNWHHFAVTYNASSNARKLYIDGQLVTSDTAGADYGGTGHLFIGKGISSGFFNGLIDEIVAWNVELTSTQVSALYNRGAGRIGVSDGTMLVGYHFDETSGTSAVDFVGSNNATLNGGMGTANWLQGVASYKGFTINNVTATQVVNYIGFNYEQPSKCIMQLAQLFEYDWYVDEHKDIHFFSKTTNSAPFSLSDTSGNYFYKTLKIKKDIKNLRNSIIVRGGIYQGTTVTESQVADGEKITFLTAYQYANIVVKVNTVVQTVGIDFIDNPASFDCLYNFNEKAVKFPTPLPDLDVVDISGNPYIPVIVKVKEAPSITQYSEYQFKVVDKSINSKQGARDRAQAEIRAWANQINEGSFSTISTGLDVGQQLHIDSTLRVIDEDYVISRIASKMYTPTQMVHDITLVTTTTFGMVEFLQKILMDKDKEIKVNENEVTDEVESASETINIGEDLVVSIVHNPQTEAIAIGEVFTAQALDYAVEFVVGEQTPPSGVKRVFILDGSPLH